MCLILERQPVCIAKQDIKVKKLLEIDKETLCYLPPFNQNGLVYVAGELYKTELKETKYLGSFFDQLASDTFFEKYRNLPDVDIISISVGFHSCAIGRRLISHDIPNRVIRECVIPKGSEYYKDISGCFVSNQIIISHIPVRDFE